MLVPRPEPEAPAPATPPTDISPAPTPPVEKPEKSARLGRILWGELLQKVFAIDVFWCNRCGGRRRVIAAITDPAVAAKILAHVGLATSAPPVLPARAPPLAAQLDLHPASFDLCIDPPCFAE